MEHIVGEPSVTMPLPPPTTIEIMTRYRDGTSTEEDLLSSRLQQQQDEKTKLRFMKYHDFFLVYVE